MCAVYSVILSLCVLVCIFCYVKSLVNDRNRQGLQLSGLELGKKIITASVKGCTNEIYKGCTKSCFTVFNSYYKRTIKDRVIA